MTEPARASVPSMGVAEFLVWMGEGNDRTELVDGEVRAMSPASVTHGTIQARLALLVGAHLLEHRPACRVVTEPALVPRMHSDANLRVPDLAVTCTADTPGQIVLADPILVVEVLSPSNQAATRSNLWAHASIPSVREMLVVHVSRIEVELWVRAPDGSWPASPGVLRHRDTLTLASIDLRLPVEAVYVGTHLA